MSGVNTTGYEICPFIIYIYIHMYIVDESVGLVKRQKYTKVGKQHGALSYQTAESVSTLIRVCNKALLQNIPCV